MRRESGSITSASGWSTASSQSRADALMRSAMRAAPVVNGQVAGCGASAAKSSAFLARTGEVDLGLRKAPLGGVENDAGDRDVGAQRHARKHEDAAEVAQWRAGSRRGTGTSRASREDLVVHTGRGAARSGRPGLRPRCGTAASSQPSRSSRRAARDPTLRRAGTGRAVRRPSRYTKYLSIRDPVSCAWLREPTCGR